LITRELLAKEKGGRSLATAFFHSMYRLAKTSHLTRQLPQIYFCRGMRELQKKVEVKRLDKILG
jgi:hypothetical protein